MKRMGRTHRPFSGFATDRRTPRDGRVIEELAHTTRVSDTDARCTLKSARGLLAERGAQPSIKCKFS